MNSAGVMGNKGVAHSAGFRSILSLWLAETWVIMVKKLQPSVGVVFFVLAEGRWLLAAMTPVNKAHLS